MPIEENIMTLLAEGEYTVKFLTKKILGDDSRKSQNTISKYLNANKIKPINNSKSFKYTTIQDLFNNEE